MKKNLFIILFGVTFLTVYSAQCQDTTTVQVPTSSFLEFNVLGGLLYGNSASINRSFQQYNFQNFDNGLLNRGLSVKFSSNKGLFKRFVFALEGNIYQGFQRSQEAIASGHLSGNSYGLSVGYIVINKPSFYLYPYLGINNNNTPIHFQLVDSTGTRQIPNVAGIFTAPQREAAIKFNNQALDLGIFAERVFKRHTIGGCPKNVRYLTVGLKAGYLLKLGAKENGRYRYTRIEDAPNYGLEGPYFQLCFGYGIKLRKINWR